MLVCSKCGYENTFGRVFCDECGSKLDLESVTKEAIAARFKWQRMLKYAPIVVGVVLVIVGVMLGLSYWPKETVIGNKGTRGGGQRVEKTLEALAGLKVGQKLDAEFDEKDINGYFEFFKVKDMKVNSVSVSVTEHYVAVRVVERLGAFGLGPIAFVPTASYDFICLSVGGRLVIRDVAMGHLPLSGPSRVKALRKLYAMFGELPESRKFQGVKSLDLKAGSLRVSVVR